MAKFQKISENSRKGIEEALVIAIVESFRKEKTIREDGTELYRYEVVLKNINFVNVMSDEELKEKYEKENNEELKKAAELAVNLLEGLKAINNRGLDKNTYDEIFEASESGEDKQITQMLKVWNKIRTDEMTALINEIDELRGVDGAYAMIVSDPSLINAILVVYKLIVDNFDNDDIYLMCAYFLLRAIMRVNSEENNGMLS